jgi:ubiquinone/menaquinone biosynthesis C-methylase UbiE
LPESTADAGYHHLMNSREVGRYWEKNADAWTKLVRAGYDVYRDSFNTSAFLAMLPDIHGMRGLDVGCGEGHNTRLVAQRGAQMTAVDIAETFVCYAKQQEAREPLGIEYKAADACELPFGDESFDFATAFMSLMDISTPEHAIAEVHRVLKPGGFFQFSITHPCFDTPHRRNLRNEHGLTYAIEVGDYFVNLEGDVMQWLFRSAPDEIRKDLPLFQVPRFTRTLSQWLNLLVDDFLIERLEEPRPSDDAVRECPDVQDAQVVAYFLHVRVRKPSARC